ncbi:hypothetical protein O181_034681 [Austropuccinia psidii MF-1]|uniref:Uncharacterized protein n=1 Tax=Austropuccinia psidii MF-1 TaxID=1389203 RepID=A0A9Q3H896_9BASI|nr:hypothetical protein [Austropuccinia psidii MF-1]
MLPQCPQDIPAMPPSTILCLPCLRSHMPSRYATATALNPPYAFSNPSKPLCQLPSLRSHSVLPHQHNPQSHPPSLRSQDETTMPPHLHPHHSLRLRTPAAYNPCALKICLQHCSQPPLRLILSPPLTILTLRH